MHKFLEWVDVLNERSFNIHDVNKKLSALNMTLIKGKGYFYFVHPTKSFYDSSVMVPKITNLSIDDWVQEAKDKLEASND